MKNKIKKVIIFITMTMTVFFYTTIPVLAADAGGNIIAESTIFKGIMKFLNDVTLVLLIAAPILGAILIIVFSIMHASTTNEHDKEKFKKYRTNVIFAMCWVFGASGVVNLVTLYLK